ncbi:unnamed protein product [Rangifer tarandus platyrhynchus]|uniref:Uncharacterized protein n=1 Tax=Rangifer tarandus platyrhynchus TaxID=3082113 RepID=A0AC59ZNA2_RANTA
MCALLPPGSHGSQPPGTHPTHTHSHAFLRCQPGSCPFAFSWALLRAPRAATKCESPARAGEPAWSREGSTGTHAFSRTPCPALKLTITFGGSLGLFFFFKGLSHYIPSKKGKLLSVGVQSS